MTKPRILATRLSRSWQTIFTGPFATGLALVLIVVGGLMVAFGEGAAKPTLAGVIFGIGMTVGAVNFMRGSFRDLASHATAVTMGNSSAPGCPGRGQNSGFWIQDSWLRSQKPNSGTEAR